MNIKEKSILLKNGKTCTLRSPEPSDAGAMVEYLRQTSGETDFLLRCPEEGVLSPEEEVQYLESVAAAPRRLMITAFIEGRLLGACGINPVADRLKTRHRASFGIALKKEAWGLGIASAMIAEAAEYAKEMGYEQLELEVVSVNERAIHLYEKCGFEYYATRQNAFKRKDGSYYTENLMMKRF